MSSYEIKHRNVFAVYAFMIFTFGLYGFYWSYKTQKEMNSLGGDIPHFILAFIPFANLYWLYKYCDAYSSHVKKDNNGILWFAVSLFFGFVLPAFVQSGLNEFAANSNHQVEHNHQEKIPA